MCGFYMHYLQICAIFIEYTKCYTVLITKKLNNMEEIICDAIRKRLVIEFNYEGELRIVEPFVLGLHKTTGNLVLRSYRVGGYSKSEREPSWRLFNTTYIENLKLTDKIAKSDREYYNPEDKHMSEILCNV